MLTQAELTQAELAERLGVSRPIVSQWVSGVRRPGLEHIFGLEKLLGAEVLVRFRTETQAEPSQQAAS